MRRTTAVNLTWLPQTAIAGVEGGKEKSRWIRGRETCRRNKKLSQRPLINTCIPDGNFWKVEFWLFVCSVCARLDVCVCVC